MPQRTEPASQQPSSARLVELDALRGIAALAVLLFHFTTRYDQLFAPREGLWLRLERGDLGVVFFFMLSGFVIFMTLERTRHALDFVVARFSRLYPAYWAAIALTFVVVWLHGLPGQEVTWKEAILNLTMIQRLLGAEHVDGVYWSLQAELFFYAAMLFLWATGALKRLVPALGIWLALAFVSQLGLPVIAQYEPRLAGALGKVATLLNLPYIQLFALGIVCYAIWKERQATIGYVALVLAALGLHWLGHGWAETAIVAAFLGVFYLMLTGRLTVLRWRPLVGLGAISYTLYLTHQNIGYCILLDLQRHGVDPNLAIALATIATVLIAAALTYAVERPALEWLRTRYRNSKLLETTETLLSAIAAAAATGGKPQPSTGTRAPAASGNSSTL